MYIPLKMSFTEVNTVFEFNVTRVLNWSFRDVYLLPYKVEELVSVLINV